jgi:hypothetical protein
MPYGVSDQLWNLLPEQDKQQIINEYNASQAGGVPAPSGDGGGADPFEEAQQDGVFAFGPEYMDFINYLFSGGQDPGAESGFNTYADAWYGSASTGGSESGGYLPTINLGGGGPQQAKFSEIGINIEGAPDWWKALSPDVTNPLSSFQTLQNLMIPFLSPEDQLTAAQNLFQTNKDQFGFYDPEELDRVGIPGEITGDIRRKFFTGERAQDTLNAFDQLLEISGKTAEDFGPGYDYLRSIADTFTDFDLVSGANQLTETQQGQLLSALDPLLAQSKSGPLQAFGPLAQSFSNPFFSAGSLTGRVRNQFGDIIQPPNPRYF